MPVRAINPPRSSELIALSQVKDLMGIADSSGDAVLSYLIRGASASIVEECGFPLARATYEQSWSGGRARRYLSNIPVEPESLTVSIDDEAVPDWTLEDENWGLLYRSSGWPCSSDGSLGVVADYRAGYLLPNDVADWTAEAPISVGRFVRPGSPSVLRFEATTAGVTGEEAPSWPGAAGQTVADGSVIWTARTAWELPPFVEEWCYGIVLQRKSRLQIPAGLASLAGPDGSAASFFATHTETSIPPSIRDGIAGFRAGRGGIG
jgi:hypothetical protein